MNVPVKPGLYLVRLPTQRLCWVHVVPPVECEPTEPIDVVVNDVTGEDSRTSSGPCP